MRLFPAQLATHLICGERLPMEQNQSLDERIEEGRRMLIKITGVDYGYDLRKWHEHLKISGEGGYTWRRNIDLPKIMKHALSSTAWNEAVQRLSQDMGIGDE